MVMPSGFTMERATVSGVPPSRSFATTSERLTALMTAPCEIAAETTAAPGSERKRAISAEASSTALLTLCLSAPLVNELLHQIAVWGGILTVQRLGALDGMLARKDVELAVRQFKDDFVANFYA